MKKVAVVLGILAAIAVGYWLWLKFSPNKFADGFYLVPNDAVMVVETEDPVNQWQNFSASEMWMGLKTFPSFSEIGKNADVLDDVIKTNQAVFSLLGQRHLLISVHMTKSKDYDFVYYADMQEASKSDILKASLTNIINQFGYTHTVRSSNGVEVHEYTDPKTREVLSLSYISNYLVCSYNKGLMDKVILASQTPALQIGMDPRFTEASQLTSKDGMCRVFINYSTFHQYLGVYMEDVADIKSLFSSMHYTGLDCSLKDNVLLADGYSMVNDSLSSYLQALSISGKSPTGSEKVLSERASFYLSLGFKDFNTFYGNLTTILQKDEQSYKAQQAALRKFEKLLKVNLQKNLFDWMGGEIAMAQYETDVLIGNKVRSVMAIKANNISSAKENLAIIEKQIRNRTPIRFTNTIYREYEIKYLEVKGLFKSLFGKLFSKIDKPYYTILGDYVVLSDDPKTLLLTIDDFIEQKTLSNKEEYRDFRSKFASETSVMAYISPNHHFANFKGLLNPESWASSKKNQQYIRCFNHVGLSLSGDGDRMRTVFGTRYEPWLPATPVVDTTDSEQDTLSSLELFLIKNFQNDMNTVYYENGNPKIFAEMDGQFYDGIYIEYYENGVIKVKGKYRDGKKQGTWKYYKPEGKFDYKEKYDNGELRRNLFQRIFGGGGDE